MRVEIRVAETDADLEAWRPLVAGGLSLEREVSLRSGARVAGALESLGHKVTALDVDAQS